MLVERGKYCWAPHATQWVFFHIVGNKGASDGAVHALFLARKENRAPRTLAAGAGAGLLGGTGAGAASRALVLPQLGSLGSCGASNLGASSLGASSLGASSLGTSTLGSCSGCCCAGAAGAGASPAAGAGSSCRAQIT